MVSLLIKGTKKRRQTCPQGEGLSPWEGTKGSPAGPIRKVDAGVSSRTLLPRHECSSQGPTISRWHCVLSIIAERAESAKIPQSSAGSKSLQCPIHSSSALDAGVNSASLDATK